MKSEDSKMGSVRGPVDSTALVATGMKTIDDQLKEALDENAVLRQYNESHRKYVMQLERTIRLLIAADFVSAEKVAKAKQIAGWE